MVSSDTKDICVVGGGINGAGIARDAAGRGLSVVLLEQDDLAQATSSRSGKLVHGGLRYLEYYEFRLVREALIEREVLLSLAPHIIWPMRFVLPHSPDHRPAWLLRAGLLLYDYLGGRKRLPATRSIKLSSDPVGDSIKEEYVRAFEYSDCWVDDARLTVVNAIDAQERGATILTRTRCTGARRVNDVWRIEVLDMHNGVKSEITAKVLINAAGPWVNNVIDCVQEASSNRQVRLVKGSHLIVKKFWQGDNAFLVQNSDKRVIFINPYEDDYALIGTTDIAFEGDPADVEADESEIDYLLNAVNRYFINQLSRRDIVSTFSGVRPLYDDNSDNPSAVTRDYLFDLDDLNGAAPLLCVFGGKITTYRKLAEHALDKLSTFIPHMSAPWTSTAPLPGGDIPNTDFDGFYQRICSEHPQLPKSLNYHYCRLYGSRCTELLRNVVTIDQLGVHFGGNFFEKEARYLVDHEWAQSAEDILTRRTKHSLHLTEAEVKNFSNWFERENPKWHAPTGSSRSARSSNLSETST